MRPKLAVMALLMAALAPPLAAQDSTLATARWQAVERAQRYEVRWTGPFGTSPVFETTALTATMLAPVLDTAYTLTAQVTAFNKRGSSTATVQQRVPPGQQPPGPINAVLEVDTAYAVPDTTPPVPPDTVTPPPPDTVQPPPPDPSFPNEPPGALVVVNEPLTSKSIPNGPGIRWEYGNGWESTPNVTVTTPGGPSSPGTAMRWTYPAGFGDGQAPGNALMTDTTMQFHASYYVAVRVRFNAGWQLHPITDKVIYIGEMEARRASGTVPSQIYIGSTGGVLGATVQAGQGYPGMPCGVASARNVPSCGESYLNRTPLTDGAWHLIEVRVDGNDAGVTNGRIRGWVDGVIQWDIRNIRFAATHASAMYGVSLVPVWGGNAGVIKQATDWMEIDHVRTSGIR